ncbi:MAG: hypothetical protein EZS28_048661, partial [Streblomastix strix]
DHSPTTSAMNQPQTPALPTAAQISVHSYDVRAGIIARGYGGLPRNEVLI